VGRLSYSLYLWHTVALALAGRFAGHLPKGPSIPWTSASYVTIAFGLASASYYFVEKPFLRLKTRFAVVGVSGSPVRESDAPLEERERDVQAA
jgi:peptidoglycan/LPS O-acetylase OafA/YrhL